MEARLSHCACGANIVKLGRAVGTGETPTHGRTLCCPSCRAGRPWDDVMFMTQAVHYFTRDGVYAGRVWPVGDERAQEAPPDGRQSRQHRRAADRRDDAGQPPARVRCPRGGRGRRLLQARRGAPGAGAGTVGAGRALAFGCGTGPVPGVTPFGAPPCRIREPQAPRTDQRQHASLRNGGSSSARGGPACMVHFKANDQREDHVRDRSQRAECGRSRARRDYLGRGVVRGLCGPT